MNELVCSIGIFGDLFPTDKDKKAAGEILNALDGFSTSEAEAVMRKCREVLSAIPIKTKR